MQTTKILTLLFLIFAIVSAIWYHATEGLMGLFVGIGSMFILVEEETK